jgi:hypothetical protein
MKFDAENVCINSSGNDDIILLKSNEPKRLPKDYGIYRNWGVLFNEDDYLRIAPQGIDFPEEKFTVCLWITLPIVKFSTKSGRRHIILAPA